MPFCACRTGRVGVVRCSRSVSTNGAWGALSKSRGRTIEGAEIGHCVDVADGARVWRCDDASSARLQRGAGLLRIFAESALDMALRSRVPMDPTPQGR